MAKEGYGSSYSNHHASNDAAQASGNRPKGDGDWYENKYHQRFTEGLLTEQATTAYDKEQKLTEYRNDDDRRDILAEYVESFNNQKYDSDRERLKYAEQIAHNTFSPLYKEIDAVEHTNETLFDPRIIRALEHHNVDYDIVKRADGTSELRFDVKDASQHRMLEAATGTKIALHDSKKLKTRDKAEAKAMGWDDPIDKADEAEEEQEEHNVGTIGSGQVEDRFWTEAETRKMLDFHRAQFAAALHGSNENAGLAVEFMHQSLTDADNAQNHYTEKTLEFDMVKDKTAAEAAIATEAMQDAHWKPAWDGVKGVAVQDEERAEELEYFLSKVRDIYQNGASVAFRSGNAGHYNLAIAHCGETAERLAEAFEKGTGLVRKDGYDWDGPNTEGDFEKTTAAEAFVKYTRDKLGGLSFSNLHHNMQSAVEYMLADLEDETKVNKKLEGRVESGKASDSDWENLEDGLRQMTRISRSIEQVMAPAAR